MQKDDIVEKIRALVSNILQDNEIELIDITYRREGRGNVLRIFADTASGITVAECARINEMVGEALDKDDIIGERYLLEVSSPGLDRPLKTKNDFLKAKGKKVQLHTYVPVDTFDRLSITPSKRSASRGENKKEFVGILEKVDGENVFILTGKGIKVSIAFDKIASARLHCDDLL